MIAGMAPRRVAGAVVFHGVGGWSEAAPLAAQARAMVREDEGVTLILEADHPAAPAAPRFAQITLDVASALDGVGLTAAVAQALAAHGIPCNVVAGLHHDHLFVPEAQADRAVALLERRAQAEAQP
jgi:hypothetical protein